MNEHINMAPAQKKVAVFMKNIILPVRQILSVPNLFANITPKGIKNTCVYTMIGKTIES